MLNPRKPNFPRLWAVTYQKRSPFNFTSFQWKYTLLLLSASTIAIVLAWVPTYFFVNQNYQFFTELAYRQAPQLLKHLEREQLWINSLFLAILMAVVGFSLIFGSRVTGRIVFPLLALENHLKAMVRGQWFSPQLKIRETDEFEGLINLYNYFYRSLLIKTKEELKVLKSLEKLSMPEDARLKIRELIKNHEDLLTRSNVSFPAGAPSHDERLAS